MQLGQVITKDSSMVGLTFATHLDAVRSIRSHRPLDPNRFIASIQNMVRRLRNSDKVLRRGPEVDDETEERCRSQLRQEYLSVDEMLFLIASECV